MYENKEIDVKKAIEIAITYIQNVYSNNSFTYTNILVEEIERNFYNDIECWFITIGFDELKEHIDPFTSIIQNKPLRKYKSVIIDLFGNVQAMKIREVEGAY